MFQIERVIDLYPYCLNQDDTPFIFPKMVQVAWKELLRRSVGFHLRPKLENVRVFGSEVRFCTRYGRVGEVARAVLPEFLNELEYTILRIAPARPRASKLGYVGAG